MIPSTNPAYIHGACCHLICLQRQRWNIVAVGESALTQSSYGLQKKESRVMPQQKWKEAKHVYRNVIITNDSNTNTCIQTAKKKMKLFI